MYTLILLEEAKQEWLDASIYYELKQKGCTDFTIQGLIYNNPHIKPDRYKIN